jgi:hypothetical protein
MVGERILVIIKCIYKLYMANTEQRIRNAYKNFLFKFSPFLYTHKNVGSIDVLDDRTVSDYSNKRFHFYGEIMESIFGATPDIVKKIFGIVNLSKYRHKKLKDDIEYIKTHSNDVAKDGIGTGEVKGNDPADGQTPRALPGVEGGVAGTQQSGGHPLDILTQTIVPITPFADTLFQIVKDINIDGELKNINAALDKLEEKRAEIKKKLPSAEPPADTDAAEPAANKELEDALDILKSEIEISKNSFTDKDKGDPINKKYVKEIIKTAVDKIDKVVINNAKNEHSTSYEIEQPSKDTINNAINKEKSPIKDLDTTTKAKTELNNLEIINTFNTPTLIKRKADLLKVLKLLDPTIALKELIRAVGGVIQKAQNYDTLNMIKNIKNNENYEEYLEDPDIGPNIDKVDIRDRGIFIVLLFIIRALALFITEWAIYSGFANTFSHTFNIYFGVYLCIFILIIILTNVKTDITFFKQIFYYVNTEAEEGKGLIRIILQIICILFILPIPYMVKDFRLKDTSPNRVLTYTEKSNIYYSVEKFTLYTWILTCVFALTV